MRPYRLICLLLLSLAACPLRAQELSGIWEGNYGKHLLMTTPQKLVVELFLHEDSLLTGASHLYYTNNRYEHYTLVGVYRAGDSMAYFREDSTLGVDLGPMGSNCLGNYTVKLSYGKEKMLLTGKWRDNSRKFLHCPTVDVYLEKPLPVKNVPKPAPPVAAKVPEAAPEPDRNLQRATDIQSLIEIAPAEKDSIKIEVLDNMEIDGDIISLYLDDRVLLHKKELSATPYTLYVSLKPGESVGKLKMAAESLGADPPCTALMVITTRTGKRYEVNLSSNFSKNAIVELFLKE